MGPELNKRLSKENQQISEKIINITNHNHQGNAIGKHNIV